MIIINGVLRIILKGLVKRLEDLEIKGQVETIQTTQDHPDYSRLHPDKWRPSRLEETCCHLNSCERPSANTDWKNLQRVKYYYYY